MKLLMKGRATASRRAVYHGCTSRQSGDPPSQKYGETCALALPRVDRGITERSDTSISEARNNNPLLQFNNFKPGRFLKSYPVNSDASPPLDFSVIKAFIIFYNFSLTTYT